MALIAVAGTITPCLNVDMVPATANINLFTEMWDPYNGGEQVFPTAP